MKSADQQFRLRQFWGNAVFSLGIFWGFANLVYFPVAAITSIVGSSWFEGFVIIAGGALTFCTSIGAFYRRRFASWLLLAGGTFLLLLAFFGQARTIENTHGIANVLLLFLSGGVALSLGIFGYATETKGWPALRSARQPQRSSPKKEAGRSR